LTPPLRAIDLVRRARETRQRKEEKIARETREKRQEKFKRDSEKDVSVFRLEGSSSSGAARPKIHQSILPLFPYSRFFACFAGNSFSSLSSCILPDNRRSAHLALNNSIAHASVFIGVKKLLIVDVALTSLLMVACEQKSPEQSGGQPASSPTPPSSATPLSSPTSTPTPATTPSAPPAGTPPPMTAPTPSPAMTTPSPSSSPSAATSDGRPTLSSEPANEYLQTYDEYINDFKTAYEAMKQGDMTKYQAVIQRAKELQSKGEKLGGELSPDEEKRFADYLNKKADELTKFASQNR
jgi:hypothetical protein